MPQHPAFKELRKSNYGLWLTLRDLRASPDPDAQLREWREAEEGTPGRHHARFYEKVVDDLAVAMGCPRREAEKAASRYISGRR